jgi:hypothetical protein
MSLVEGRSLEPRRHDRDLITAVFRDLLPIIDSHPYPFKSTV